MRLRVGYPLLAAALALPLAPAGAIAATAPVAASTAVGAADGTESSALPGGRLSYSPRVFVGGQALTFRGSLGVRGERRIVLQHHMNRPGDSWVRVLGFRGRTRQDGSFRFKAPAPSMFGISYRVLGKGGHPSPRVTMAAKTQDHTLWVAGDERTDEQRPGVPVAGGPFTISVDTTPENLYRRPDTKGLPVFVGRRLTLQKRVAGMRWSTLAATKVRTTGLGFFTGVRAPAGTTVYRVRQENRAAGANEIGWTPSFPLYVRVASDQAEAQRLQQRQRQQLRHTLSARSVQPATVWRDDLREGPTASQRYRWMPSLFDFAWEHGQSLTSKPYRGTLKRGRWVDYVGGSGRVSKHNGGLSLDSKRHNGPGRGDWGTTRATLHGNARAYGRWEVKLRLKASEKQARDYSIRVELVPERARDYDCGRHNITIGAVRAHGRGLSFGVNAGGQKWTGSHRVGNLVTNPRALAAEVQRRHITWFLDGRPMGTVKNAKAVPRVPMTLRLSMVGQGRREMNQTTVLSDWQRGFGASTGKKVRSGAPLKHSKLGGSCSS